MSDVVKEISTHIEFNFRVNGKQKKIILGILVFEAMALVYLLYNFVRKICKEWKGIKDVPLQSKC